MEVVPDLGIMNKEEIITIAKEGFKSHCAFGLQAEGIVADSYPLMLFRNGNPMKFKLKSNDYKKLQGEKNE